MMTKVRHLQQPRWIEGILQSWRKKDKYRMISVICDVSKTNSLLWRTDWWLPEGEGEGKGKMAKGISSVMADGN